MPTSSLGSIHFDGSRSNVKEIGPLSQSWQPVLRSPSHYGLLVIMRRVFSLAARRTCVAAMAPKWRAAPVS
jgi:hypothetical protein